MIPPALNESDVVSFRPIASSTLLSRKAGTTPSPAEMTIRSRTPPSRSLYGANSRPMRFRFARRTSGSAGRSAGASEEWKNMPIGDQGTSLGNLYEWRRCWREPVQAPSNQASQSLRRVELRLQERAHEAVDGVRLERCGVRG